MKNTMRLIGLLALLSIGTTLRGANVVLSNNLITEITRISGSTNFVKKVPATEPKSSLLDFYKKIELKAAPTKPDHSLLVRIVDDAIPRDGTQIPYKDTWRNFEYMGASLDVVGEHGRKRTLLVYRFRIGRDDAFETGIESIEPSLNGVYIVKVGASHSF